MKINGDSLLSELSCLYEIASLGEAQDLEELLETAKEKAIRLFGLSHYAVFLETSRNERRVFCGWRIKTEEEAQEYLEKAGLRAFYYPFKRNGIGGFLLMAKQRPLQNSEMRLFRLFAHSVEDAMGLIVNLEKLKETQKILEEAFWGMALALTKLVERRDPYTTGHSLGVAELSRKIGEKMGLSEKELMGLYISGLLHDIGKSTIPLEILVKPGRLNELEMKLIRLHAQAGYEILKDIAFPWPVALVALQHHERLDGSGYPQGLKGYEIIREAKIVAVADIVDAMTHDRPYRPGYGIEKAKEELKENKGKKYDPEVVEACLLVLKDHA